MVSAWIDRYSCLTEVKKSFQDVYEVVSSFHGERFYSFSRGQR